jgi:hypothetical protein
VTRSSRQHGSALLWAVGALWREFAGFRFHYEAADVPDAQHPGALRYHLDSPRLFADAMRLDSTGVPYQVSRTFTTYNPAYVAWYGLQQLQDAELRGALHGRDRFLKQVAWLRDHAVSRPDGAAVWQYDFDWREGDSVLRAGWISAMAQGLAMSALVRANRLEPDPALLELAVAAARPFELPISEGGVRSAGKGGAIFEEYPALPPPRVLDGTLFAMLGLFDIASETSNSRLRALFSEGMDGLESELTYWDFRDKWSWYGRRSYLCPTHYHAVNRALLQALARASGRSPCAALAERWNPSRLGAFDRAEVFLSFVVTKQRSRLNSLLHAWRARRESRQRES